MRGRIPEGWYLMNTAELEQELARHRGMDVVPSSAVPLTVSEALNLKALGNLPDAEGRTLRLVLHVADRAELKELDSKRLTFEPDVHESPRWRRAGSAPINVVPLRIQELEPAGEDAWWEEPELAALEKEWRASGRVSGISVPGAYRGFVYKTVLALNKAALPITPATVADSVARWVSPRDAEELRIAMAKDSPT
jgi:hypothetical protein